jgi:hypothetical protein
MLHLLIIPLNGVTLNKIRSANIFTKELADEHLSLNVTASPRDFVSSQFGNQASMSIAAEILVNFYASMHTS